MGSVAEGNVTLTPTDKGFAFGYAGIQKLGNIQLRNANYQIVEAQGWVTNGKGEVILVAQASTATPTDAGFLSQECGVQ
ncbi:MAG TPA: hypothetical protein V6D28_29410 [Leptolyngbyaceae cyanobacterium]